MALDLTKPLWILIEPQPGRPIVLGMSNYEADAKEALAASRGVVLLRAETVQEVARG